MTLASCRPTSSRCRAARRPTSCSRCSPTRPRWQDWAGSMIDGRRSGSARAIPRPAASARCASSGAGRPSRASRSSSTTRRTTSAYTIVRGIPVRGYHADIDLVRTTDGGTTIRWAGAFEPKVPGTGALFDAVARTHRARLRDVGAAERSRAPPLRPARPTGSDLFRSATDRYRLRQDVRAPRGSHDGRDWSQLDGSGNAVVTGAASGIGLATDRGVRRRRDARAR